MRALLVAVVAFVVLTALPLSAAVENPPIVVVRVRNQTVQSSNWAGYVDFTGGPGFTYVTGTFTATSVSGASGTYSSHWTGIGGFAINDRTLIQAGFDEDVDISGNARYWAWYELLPAAATPICGSTLTCAAYPIGPSDVITVTIQWLFTTISQKQYWSISIANTGKWLFSITVQYNSKQASAEWISERPLVGGTLSQLANFGTMNVAGGQTKYRGTLYNIAGLPNYQVVMVNSAGTVLAQPSALNGGSFSVSWQASG